MSNPADFTDNDNDLNSGDDKINEIKFELCMKRKGTT